LNKQSVIGLANPAFRVDDELQEWMRDIRHHLHRYPEVSYRENKTNDYIHQKLDEIGINDRKTVAGTGVAAVIGNENPAAGGVGLRADMDGLPIGEETGLPFSSKTQGVMHACGHDGHVAMLLGAIRLLQDVDLVGQVKLLFQPAEEHGNGAEEMIRAGVLDGLSAIFSGHIDTHFPTGTLTIDEGIICANTNPFTIHVYGRSGHAARPHETADAIVAASSLVTSIQTLVSREADPTRSAVVTIGSFRAGTIHNIIAGSAVLQGTIRSIDLSTREKTINGLRRIVESIGTMYRVETALEFEAGLPAVSNSPSTVRVAREAALQSAEVRQVVSQEFPSLGGEDFSFYQQLIDGCMVRFGAFLSEKTGPAHSSTFNFDEAVFRTGASWLAAAAVNWLQNNNSGEE